ncbi:aquaporin [uncultured Paracoccus sp.]|uniref:aquaporin n=1 Tax=uncultured Paracoccus sp. TaxID=189685 RepID=UPI002608BA0B|nr:aquaporin [uncultured Paracoccus sp.]
MSSKAIAEFIGTFILVFFGVGSAVLMGDLIGFQGIAFAFGLSIVAAAYGFGVISGAQLNPAVSLGFLASGRLTMGDFVTYCIAQILGAIAGAAVIYVIASGKADYSIAANGLGQNGFGEGYNGGYTMMSAFVFEFVATFLFVTVILGATQSDAPVGFGGLAIGLTLTGIHLVGIDVTGVSVNPARSIGPAIFAGGAALSQLWLFLLAPLAGGLLAGVLHGAGITRSPHAQPKGFR